MMNNEKTPAASGPLDVAAGHWEMQPLAIPTRWAASVDPGHVWPEYPRPQMVRARWQNLNGLWEYAITPKNSQAARYSGHILVPFPVESALSGVKQPLHHDQVLWYRRTIQLAPRQDDERVLLHFGAVDYEASVYLNGIPIGAHSGGYQNFTLDLSEAMLDGANELVVKVWDPTEHGPNPRGKQKVQARSMFYSPSSGIWQTVWLERVPSTHIDSLKLTPDVDRSELDFEAALNGDYADCSLEVTLGDGDTVVARQQGRGRMQLRIEQPRLWSTDDPHLYHVHVRLVRGDRLVDEVRSYFGMRKVELKQDAEGRARIHLNGCYTFNLGIVDQGFWPDGLYTAANDAALCFDVQAIKALGFNMVRKHIKVEPQRWYYHCDRLGLIVWQDMPFAGNDSPQARAQFEHEVAANIRQLHNHPSITTWVVFNEGWGAYDPERLTRWVKQLDPTRLVNGHSGPYDQLHDSQWIKRREAALLLQPLGGRALSVDDLQGTQYRAPASWRPGDIADIHIYPGPEMFPARPDVASATGEHGSFGVYIEGHVWDELDPVGLGVGASGMTPQQMLAAYASSIETLKKLERQGLSAASYFQIADVEKEQQGLLTYDRAVAKLPVGEIARLNAEIIPRAANQAAAERGFFIESADWTPESQRYASLVDEFGRGRRDAPFLRRLALTALRQGDTARATDAASEFIARATQPFSRETWKSIVAMTFSSQDEGFELLRTRADEANAMLGRQGAEKKIQEIIGREIVTPYFKDKERKVDWNVLEESTAARFGALGREAVIGARMMEELLNEDWSGFGASYVRYFETAVFRSPYSHHSLSYRVLTSSKHRKVLEAATTVMAAQISFDREYPVFGLYDPAELDTYANLLHAVGRVDEALQWLERAVMISHGRDPEILANLRRMKADHGMEARAARGA